MTISTDARTASAIDLDAVTKRFGAVTAVDGLSLSIQAGEVVALLGPNGAGKTTTIDMILGLTEPSDGAVSVHDMTPRRAVSLGLVSAVMQSGGLLKDYTVGETIELTAALFRPVRPIDEVLERAGIADIRDRRVGKCSGGQQQRLRFALALLPDPELLILDEPTTGMDVEGRRDFWNAIREDSSRGRTTIFATHYLEEADAYADRIVVVNKGHIVADGTASEVKRLAAGRTVRATLPGADQHRLAQLAGVEHVDVRGDSVFLHGNDTDSIARYLLTETAAHEIEITSRNLEDAFVALTSDDSGSEISEGATV